MTYELAKELKEAGFPQGDNYRPVHRLFMNAVYDPTLSELIEECVALSESGDFHLEHWEDSWGASTCWRQPKPGFDEWLYGETPEEAVARLWLALNKK